MMLTGSTLRRAMVWALLAGVTVGASNAAAQVDYEIISALQFNFSNPGARSLAMAGALTGAGDDATGAWTNPGGLTNISKPEVGFEFRGFSFLTPFTNGGRFNGSPQRCGVPSPTTCGVDTETELNFGESEDKTNSLSFVSAVLPKSRFAFAFYRTEVANFETSIATDGAFYDVAEVTNRLLPVAGSLSLKIANYGGSAAVRLSDQVSLGVGLSFYQFTMDSNAFRYRLRNSNIVAEAIQPGFFFGPALRTDANVATNEIIEGDDSAIGVNIGASFNPSSKVRIGASYRLGPSFELGYRRILREDNNVNRVLVDDVSEFRLPDVLSLGVLVRPSASVNIAFDYRRVRYSRITQGMDVVIGDEPTSDFFAEDANELRGALEFLRPVGSSILALRAGVWLDPDHRIQYRGSDLANQILYVAGDDEIHYTGGAGLVINNAFQIDGGYDHSERVKTFSISAIYRF